MRILIDATTAREGGGTTYIRNILPALLRQAEVHEYHILLSSLYQGKLITELPEKLKPVAPRLPATPLVRWLYLQMVVPHLLRRGGFDLFFSVSEVSALHTPCPRVVLAQNLKFYTPLNSFPQFSQRWHLLIRRLTRQPFAYLTVRSADRIIFVSESFRQTVMARMHLCREKTQVIYHGLNPVFRLANDELSADPIVGIGPYLLTVSSITEHKNVETLLQGFARVIVEGADQELQLTVVGSSLNTGLCQSLLSQASALGIANRVHFVGHVEPERLVTFYRNAKVFVLPSRLESFGLPLIEAMACGAPVVASDLPVCREICKDAALYFSPSDPETLATQVLTILRRTDMAEELIQRGLERAKDFSWDNTAQQLVRTFEEVVLEYQRPG